MKLNDSRVVFNDIEHTYTLDGKQLVGITGMIKRQLFPDEYANVSEAVLANAAQRGHAIHSECELIDDLGINPNSEEGASYIALLKEQNLNYHCSEYIVTDNEYFASPIDKVYAAGEEEVILADIKTTYRLNEEYVRWQLSIYAHLFEVQNPHIKVKGLMAIWLRGKKSKAVYLDRIPSEEVQRLMDCEKRGEQYKIGGELQTIPTDVVMLQTTLLDLIAEEKQMAETKKTILAKVREAMVAAGIKKWETDIISVTVKADTERESIDTKALKAEHPDIYENYKKVSKVQGSLVITDRREKVS